MPRTYKSTIINRTRSAIRASVDYSWAGAQPLQERRLIKKTRDMYVNRVEIYAAKVQDDMTRMRNLLEEVAELPLNEPLTREMVQKIKYTLMDYQP